MRPGLFMLFLFMPPSARGADYPRWTPIFDTEFLLGQVFQNGKATSWEGNASLQFTPAIKASDSLALLPTYSGYYQGTKNVAELAGGAQLFQDSQGHLLNLKAIYQIGAWKIKPTVSYRWELLRETSAERWGKGLFDYRKPAAGLEADYALLPKVKLNAAFDYYAIDFPNYASLESQVSSDLGREQSQIRTLNSRNLSWTTGGEFPLPFEGGSARITGNFTERDYPEQRLVNIAGGLVPNLRSDAISSIAGGLYYGRALSPKVRGIFSCKLTYTHDDSNQNHYDPELNIFNPNYYSYEERSIEPRITAFVGAKKAEISVAYLRIERNYLGRVAQDAAGTYLNELMHLTQDTFLVNFLIPITGGLRFVAHSTVSGSGSNMIFEKTFRYNYTISSHLLGISYSY